MESINTFNKGINTDVDKIYQPEGTYRSALNMSIDEPIQNLSSNKGINLYSISSFPSNLSVIGECYLNNDLIVFLTDDVDDDRIAVIENFNTNPNYVEKLADSNLNFSSNNPIQAVGRILFDNERVVYFTDNSNPIRSINLDITYTGNIVSQLELITTQNISSCKLNSIVSGGNLFPGTYEFVARYLTNDTLNSTTFGIPSNPIYIKGEPAEVTNNAIKVDIDNVDTNFSLVELAVITYSDDFIPTISIIKRLNTSNAINGTITTIYSGNEEVLDVATEEELNVKQIYYTKAKTLTQKDNRLFAANLKSSSTDYNFQSIANKITMQWTTKSIDYTETTGDINTNSGSYNISVSGNKVYDNPENSHDLKGYMRDEVYSFGIVYIFKNGYISPTYHIPGNRTTYSFSSVTNSGGTNKVVLNFTDSNTYQRFRANHNDRVYVNFDGIYNDGNYKVLNTGNNFIVIDLPYVSNTIGTVMGIAPSTGTVMGSYVSDEEYPIGMNYPTGKITHHRMPSLDRVPHFENSNPRKIRVLGVQANMPASDPDWLALKDELQSIVIVREPRDSVAKRSIITQGLQIPSIKTTRSSTDFTSGNVRPDLDAYSISPWLGKTNFNTVNYITSLADFNGPITDNFGNLHKSNLVNQPLIGNDDVRYHKLQFFFSPETIILKSNINADKSVCNLRMKAYPRSYDGGTAGRPPYHSFFDFIDNESLSDQYVNNISSGGGVYCQGQHVGLTEPSTGWIYNATPFATDDNLPILNFRSQEYFAIHYNDVYEEIDYNKYYHEIPSGGVLDGTVEYKKDLVNLKNDNNSQYGNLTNAYYTKAYKLDDLSQTLFSFYNGDTYISKFSFTNYLNLRATFDNGQDATNRLEDPRFTGITESEGIEWRTLGYFFVESKVNCDLRHKPFDSTTNTGGVDFFPNLKIISGRTSSEIIDENTTGGLLDIDPSFGNSTGYNQQYSLDGNTTLYNILPETFQEVTSYPNRVIYSDLAIEGDRTDAYKIFLPNNFQDIPKDTGAINSLIVHNDRLYSHTDRALWLHYVNDREALVSNVGEVVTGNSGVFPLPAKKFAPNGTLNTIGNILTPYGYIFVDHVNSKVILLRDGIEVLSDKGLMNYFNTKDFSINTYENNPYKNKGTVLGFDQRSKKFYFVDHVNSECITYSFLNSAWISNHSTYGDSYIIIDDELYSYKDGLYYKHNESGNKQYGLDVVYTIDYICNPSPARSTKFDAITMVSNNAPTSWQNRTEGQYSQDTGVITAIPFDGSIDNNNYRRVDDQYQLHVGRDSGDEQGRLRGKYMISRFVFNSPVEIDLIKTRYRINYR